MKYFGSITISGIFFHENRFFKIANKNFKKQNLCNIACLHDQKGAFFEGRLLSSQSKQFENTFKSSDFCWGPPKKAVFVLIM